MRNISGKHMMQVEKSELLLQNSKLRNLAIGHFGKYRAIGKNKAGNLARIKSIEGLEYEPKKRL